MFFKLKEKYIIIKINKNSDLLIDLSGGFFLLGLLGLKYCN